MARRSNGRRDEALEIRWGHIAGLSGVILVILGCLFGLYRNVAMQDQAVDKKVYEAQHEALQSNVTHTSEAVDKVKDGLHDLQTKQAVMDSKLDEVKTQMGSLGGQITEVLRAVSHGPKGKDP